MIKRFLTIAALLVFTFSHAPSAEAKRFGGGSLFGKSFKTAPAPKKATTNTSSINKNGAATTNRGGLMGGLMGGLLAGGLLAAFFGGAFEGIQFMDILIIGLIAYFIIRFLRGTLAAKQASMNREAFSYSGRQQDGGRDADFDFQNEQKFSANPSSGAFGASSAGDVPFNFTEGFDQAAFINGAREHYRIIQGAWNHNELDTIQEYVSPSLFEDLKAEREKLGGEQHTDVMYIDAEIVRADVSASTAQLSLQFKGRYRDAVEGIEEDITDIWHLERDLVTPNAPWLIIGIQGS